MIKTMFALGALALAVATPAAAQMAAGSLPKCSATVRDSCDQGASNPRAMTADQAMASGGVGDRKSDGAAMAPMPAGHPMMHHKMTRKHMMMHHKMMTKTTDSATTDPKPM